MRSGGGSFGRISLHVGADWWTFLSTYDDAQPDPGRRGRVDHGDVLHRGPQGR